jgi:hypothetical protein
MSIKKRLFAICATFVFVMGIATPLVKAETIGIAVDQTSIAFDADIGEKQEFVITVTNISDRMQEVVVGAMDYLVGDNNDLVLDQEFNEQDGIKDWITTEQPRITLAPDQSEEVRFVFRAPSSAPVGSHRGAAVFRSVPGGGGDVAVQGQIAIHVLVNIKGNTHASGRLNAFDVPLFVFGDVEYRAEFENTGNIHYVPYGEVVVKNVFTKKERAHKYEKHFVFPNKKFTFIFADEIPSIFGLYKARATFVDGEGVTRSRSDYMMGYGFPFVFIAIMIALYVLWKWIARTRHENSEEKDVLSNDTVQKRQLRKFWRRRDRNK